MTTPIAEAYVTITPNTAGFAAAVQRDVTVAMARVNANLRATTSAGSRAFSGLGDSARGAASAADGLSGALEGVKGGLASLGASAVQAVTTSLQVATTAAIGLGVAASTIGLKGAANIQSLNIRFTALKDQLQLGNQSVAQFVQSLRDLDLQTGLSTNSLANAVTRFTSLGTSAEGAVKLTTIFGDALATLGLSGGDLTNVLNSVITQLSQAASVGKFGGDELKSVLENLGGLVSRSDIISRVAKNTGQSIGDVAKQLNDGALGFGEGFNALVQDLADPKNGLSGALERQANTLPGVVNRIKKTVQQGLEDAFLPQLNGLADQLNSALEDSKPALADFGASIASGFAAVAPGVIAALPDIVEGLALGFQALAPFIADAASAAATLASAIVDHKDEIADFLDGFQTGLAFIKPVIEPLAAVLGQIFTNVTEVGNALAFLEPTFSTFGQGLGVVLDAVALALGAAREVAEFLMPAFEVIATDINALTSTIKSVFLGAINLIIDGLQKLFDAAGHIPDIPGLPDIGAKARDASSALQAVQDHLNALNGSVAVATVKIVQYTVTSPASVFGQTQGGAGGVPFVSVDQQKQIEKERKAARDAIPQFPNTGAQTNSADTAAASAAKAAAAKMKKAFSELGKDIAAISKKTADQSIADIHREFDALTEDLKDSGNKEFIASANKVEAQLVKVAKQRDRLNDQLKNATTNLADLKKESADYAASIRTTVVALGDVSQASKGINTTFNGIRGQLVSAIGTTAAFAAAIKSLTAAGLNQSSLKQLLDAGPQAGLAAANALAGSGAGGIAQINQLQAQLDAQGKALGASASSTLYTAGVQAAQGLVDGLKSQEAAIEAQMTKIAKRMAASIKKALEIRSPSALLSREVGRPAGQGIINGLMGEISKASGVASSVRSYATNVTFGPGSVVAHGATEAGASRMGNGIGYAITDVLERQLAAAQLGGFA